MFKKLPLSGFLFGVLAAVALAALFPSWGLADGPLRTGTTTRVGVFIIFLLQGIGMPTESLRQGMLQWRLHTAIQAYIFLAFPLITFLFLVGARFLLPEAPRLLLEGDLGLGFLYLAILPTTISTAVVMISQARGSIAPAVFNTAGANIFGILWVPLVATFLVSQIGDIDLPLGQLLQTIFVILLLPFILGQLIRPFLKEWAGRQKKSFTQICNFLIYYMIFVAFAQSFENEVWSSFGSLTIGVALGGVIFLLVFHTLFSHWLGGKLGLSQPDRVCFLYCASQKTLAAGLPMAGMLFALTDFEMGVVVLPLMLYHPLQIIFGGLLAQKLAKAAEA